MTATLAVLAGGEGSRMGGPKDHLRDCGRPVLEALLERIRWPGPTLLVAPHGDRLPDGHHAFHRFARDLVPGQGPLRGILTALLAAETDTVLFIPVDMPGIEAAHLAWLQDRTRPSGVLGVLLSREHAGKPRIESFPCACRVGAAGMIKRRLDAGIGAIHLLAEEPGIETIPAPQEWGSEVWKNVNQLGDLPPHWQRST